MTRSNEEPQLWVIEGFNATAEPTDILSLMLDPIQYAGSVESEGEQLQDKTLEDLLSDRIFAQDNPPRWVILISLDQTVLIDRHKWNALRLLRFDLYELLNERDPDSLLATATLLHREHTCPTEGSALLDELDENSHRHTYSVSEDLKFALRQTIEILGNEVLHYRRTVSKRRVFPLRHSKSEENGRLTQISSNRNVCAGCIGCCLCFTLRHDRSWAMCRWVLMCTGKGTAWRHCGIWSRLNC